MIYTKTQLDTPVTLLDGGNVTTDRVGGKSLTVRTAIREALSALFQDEQQHPLPFEQKMKRYEIAKKVWADVSEIELTIEDLAEIKICVGKYLYGEALGFVIEFLEKK